MQNVKSYFSSWKTLWKSSKLNTHSGTLKLAPSNINFTSSSLGDLKHSIIDEKLMIDISTKLIESISPPKLQIYAHNNHWFALNNSHLLIYRQLERVGLCDTVVCDIIRSEDVPIGIRQTDTPVAATQQVDEEGSANEVIYCADIQADTCGCLDDDDSIATGAESEENEDSDDEQIACQNNPSLSKGQFDEVDLDETGLDKELQCLLFK